MKTSLFGCRLIKYDTGTYQTRNLPTFPSVIQTSNLASCNQVLTNAHEK